MITDKENLEEETGEEIHAEEITETGVHVTVQEEKALQDIPAEAIQENLEETEEQADLAPEIQEEEPMVLLEEETAAEDLDKF